MYKDYIKKPTKSNFVNIVTTDDFLSVLFAPRVKDCERVSGIMSELDQERASRICECGHYLELKTPIIEGEIMPKKTKVFKANFCKDRLCPMCAWRLAVRNFSNLLRCVDVLKSQGQKFLFLTLTVPNCEGYKLRETIEYLKESLVRFRRTRDFKKAFNGYFCKLEVTYKQEDKTYHPHLHLLLSVDSDYFSPSKYLTAERIVELWGQSTKDLLFAYNRKNNKDLKGFSISIEAAKDDGTNKDINELAKYSVKSFDILPETIETLSGQLNNVRMISYFGNFGLVHKQLRLEDEKLVDDIRDDIDYILTKYQYDKQLGHYVQIFGGVTYEQKDSSYEGSLEGCYSEILLGDPREQPQGNADNCWRSN